MPIGVWIHSPRTEPPVEISLESISETNYTLKLRRSEIPCKNLSIDEPGQFSSMEDFELPIFGKKKKNTTGIHYL
jgi:hypothetical protein